jgi:hypothetical protein
MQGKIVDAPTVRLSSRLTFFHKLVFPTMWMLAFASGTLLLSISRDPKAHELTPIFGLVTLLGGSFLSAISFPLKTVIANQDGIVVGNFLRQIQVPYDQIASVKENKWINTRLTTIWLRADSGFGQKIKFQPYTHRTFKFWKDHPAVVLLRERVQAAQDAGGVSANVT